MQKKHPNFPWSKYLSWFLVFLLLVSQTIRVDFFDTAEARPEDYRDIVSIVVDKETYGSVRAEILRYVKDIEWYLGGVRASVLVIDPDTPPAVIAAKNERLYYEGDWADGVSHLIGTVLIWNVPVPMVNISGKYFPSLYPYVDFVDKQFVYNERTSQYESPQNATRLSIEPEVWHGVISPAVWRKWDSSKDITKIKNFLDKTHDFYTKSGKFAPNDIPPRVFYYDGFYESKSVNIKKLFQYGLSMQNSENLAYKRFTKYLLKDLNSAMLAFDKTNSKEYDDTLTDLGISPGSDILSDEVINTMPDIQTETPIRSILTNFKGIFNEKTLSDSLSFIHNSGRYNSGSSMRADIAPITMTLKDEVARSTLKEANTTLQESIDKVLIDGKIAKRIPIFDRIETSSGVPISTATGTLDIYDNYFFGEKSSNINDPAQCTLARGSNKMASDFGREVLVEANVWYDITSVSDHTNILSNDTQELVSMHTSSAYSCFTSAGQAKIQSLWWWNSLLRATNSTNPADILQESPGGTNLTGFGLPIFSLGGMKETTRFSPASVKDCIDPTYQYVLRPPYQVGDRSCSVIYPTEWSSNPFRGCWFPLSWNPPRFTCVTNHDTSGSISSLAQSIVDYSSRNCFSGSLNLDWKVISTINRPCITFDINSNPLDNTNTNGNSVDSTNTDGNINNTITGTMVDNTRYENQFFHTIPSILHHVSPTESEISAAKSNGLTPSLAVDMDRYVEFLTPKGNIAQLHYPNFFVTPWTDVPSVRAWLSTLAQNDWNAIIAKENSTSVSSLQAAADAYLATWSIPSAPIDWNDFITDEFIEKVLQAKNWLKPDAIEKYKKTVESSLSYSDGYIWKPYDSSPSLPKVSDSYEIAYLGLTSLTPSSTEDSQWGYKWEYNSIANDYATQIATIQALNISDPYDASDNNASKEADKCWPPEGVDLYKWPQAIMCWIKAQFPPKIMAWSCWDSTLGLSSSSHDSSSLRSPTATMYGNESLMRDFYAWGELFYTTSRTNMGLNDTTEVQVWYAKWWIQSVLPLGTEVSLVPVRSSSERIVEISPTVTQATDSVAKFLVNTNSKKGGVTLQATMKIPIPDGEPYTLVGKAIDISISDEYLDIDTANGKTQFDVTSNAWVTFNFSIKNGNGDVSIANFPLTLDIYDDVDNVLIWSGIVVNSSDFVLPSTYAKKVWVYRLVFSDKQRRVGETTVAIRSWKLSQVSIVPISSTIVRWSSTIGMIELKDALWNLISPELHSVDVWVTWGYLLEYSNQKKESMHIDAMEPQIPISLGSDKEGTMIVEVAVDGSHKVSIPIQVIRSANFVLSVPKTPKVGGETVPVTFQITDGNGNILSWFNSVATLTLPNDAGYFTPEAIPVKAWVASFEYTPWTYAGNHTMSVAIPGINTIADQKFFLNPGDALYITHKLEGGNILFSLRDRYGNLVPEGLAWTISRNSESPSSIVFTQWVYSVPARSWYYLIKVPALSNNSVSYTDSDGVHSIPWIPHYATYIDGLSEGFDFPPDYNARYTVLGGGSFLREGEDILFNTHPGQWQSLAVSTLLDGIYSDSTLFSIIPWGWFSLGYGIDDIPEAQITLENGFPVLGVVNNKDHSRIARVVYRMNNARFDTCSYSWSLISTAQKCFTNRDNNSITLAINTDYPWYTAKESWGNLVLDSNGTPILSLWKDGFIVAASWLRFSPHEQESWSSLVMDIEVGDSLIGKLIYTTNRGVSVAQSLNPFGPVTQSTPLIDGTSMVTSEEFSHSVFGDDTIGYRFLGTSQNRQIDAEKNGPTTMDSLAFIPENPGIGWKWNNTMLLSYAAGDTVGEATKWFHTFTFVNLGDPVAHVDEKKTGTQLEGIDRTIGTRITSPNNRNISTVSHRDMNADGYEDIVTLHSDGHIGLFLNQVGKFRFREQIAYVPSLVSRWITLGDFTNDGYADIIGVNNSGSFIYIDNTNRKFAQVAISIPAASGGAPVWVTQFRVYDMDSDKKDDIVYLTEWGELGVLYGSNSPGIFDKKILDANLWITLDSASSPLGWAIKTDSIPQFPPGSLGVSPTTDTDVDAAKLQGNIYYQFPRVISSEEVDSLGSASEISSTVDTYIQSQYASAYGIEVSKTFQNISNSTVHAGDKIEVAIALRNTGTATAKNVSYIDTIPAIFSAEKTKKYQLVLDGQVITRDFHPLESTDYDAYFVWVDIPPGKTLYIKYQLTALPASYGEMLVGDFEQGETGTDTYGDAGFKTSTTCGADMLLWRSGQVSRDYVKWTRTFAQAQLPSHLASQFIDADKNGIPDSMDMNDSNGDGVPDGSALSLDARQKMLNSITKKQAGESTKPLLNATMDTSSNKFTLGFNSSAVEDIVALGDSIMSWLQCGFGWWSCMSFPLNWAPLAPGNDPPILGFPWWDGLKVDEWIPIMSALTCIPLTITCGNSPCTIGIPAVWPVSVLRADSFALVGGANNPKACGVSMFSKGAWWMLWVDAKANFLRIFVTPTLTLGMGAAMCFGAPASKVGKSPWLGYSPLIQGGNCIVVTDSMPFCKWDGSKEDGDVRGVSWLGSITQAWNAESCSLEANTRNILTAEEKSWTDDVIAYLKNPDMTRLNSISSRMQSNPGNTRNLWGPLLRIWGWWTKGTSVEIGLDSSKPLNLGNIVKVKNKRIAGFPDFVMDWVQRQGDEIVKALFTVPHLTLYAPKTLGQNAQFDGSFQNFLSRFSSSSLTQWYQDLKNQMGNAYNSSNAAASLSNNLGRANSSFGKSFGSIQQDFVANNASTINTVAGWLSTMKAAYKFIGKLPFITIKSQKIPINVPWILPSELDKYARALEWYEKEVNRALGNLCVNKTVTECANAKASLNSSGLVSSINQNLKRIREYKEFPNKLQKYVTWKQRYMSQILCNVNTIAQLAGWWLKDNGIRFRKWVELYVLIKAIADSWQPILDIFYDTSAQCGVCRNQRHDLTYWKFKLISAVIPSIPVIKFPRWPNIVLDLSDVQLGLHISVPEFQFKLTPIQLPNLPSLSLPNFSAGLSLPSLPVLPPIPTLPDLPSLPSFPKLSLPNLPPPPKLPKIMSSLSGVIKIFKLISKMYCWYNSTHLISEDQVWSVIADRTERQGKLSIDFLNVLFPNISIQTIKEIRVSSHVNFKIRSDFISEFARSAVKPINSFTTDLSRWLPNNIWSDVNIQSQKINIKPQTNTVEDVMMAYLKSEVEHFITENSESLDIEDAKTILISEMKKSGLPAHMVLELQNMLHSAREHQEWITNELVAYNDARFDLIRKYIQAEYDETAELQNIVDALQDNKKLLSWISNPSRMVSDSLSRRSDGILEQYKRTYEDTQSITEDSSEWDDSFHMGDTVTNLQSKITRLAANSNIVSQGNTNIAPGYAPSFKGIYVLTPSGTQTRLFDYIDELTGKEKVNVVDIDKDGDNDYIYLVDGIVYVKYTHTNQPNKIQDFSIQVDTIGTADELPTAPDFFHENINTPGSLSVEFTPSSSDEKRWRMEFFDRYLEWDNVDTKTYSDALTPKSIIDLEVSTMKSPSDTNQIIQFTPVSKYLSRVRDVSSFMMVGPGIAILTWSTQFTLSPGKILYTGKEKTKILYHTGTSADAFVVLDPYTGYTFSELVSITLQSGKLYTITAPFAEETYTYSNDMIGMPILPGMKITSLRGGFEIWHTSTTPPTSVAPGANYMLIYLGKQDTSYSFSIDYKNSFYSARIRSLDYPKGVSAWPILLAPQASSDRSAPVVDFPDSMRIPVYSVKTMKLSDYITERSNYTVLVDPDITTDADWNGVMNDDFSSNGGNDVMISSWTLVVWLFDVVGNRTAQIQVIDEFNNITESTIDIEIYAPVPQISTSTQSGWILWKIDEPIASEPVDVFRVRSGTPITRITKTSLITGNEGLFRGGSYFTQTGGTVLNLWGSSLNISERWVFQMPLPSGMNISISPANQTNPMSIKLVSSSWVLYSQSVILPSGAKVLERTWTGINSTGSIQVTTISWYVFTPASLSDPEIPGGGYIVDSNNSPVIAIAPDGNIYTLMTGVSLGYNQKDGYMLIEVKKDGVKVSEVWYTFDFFYTIK